MWSSSWGGSRTSGRGRCTRGRRGSSSGGARAGAFCLEAVSPLHVAAYWLVVSQVLPANPAAAVRGPKHVVTKGATQGGSSQSPTPSRHSSRTSTGPSATWNGPAAATSPRCAFGGGTPSCPAGASDRLDGGSAPSVAGRQSPALPRAASAVLEPARASGRLVAPGLVLSVPAGRGARRGRRPTVAAATGGLAGRRNVRTGPLVAAPFPGIGAGAREGRIRRRRIHSMRTRTVIGLIAVGANRRRSRHRCGHHLAHQRQRSPD